MENSTNNLAKTGYPDDTCEAERGPVGSSEWVHQRRD
jgi:hypothetical protein